MHVGLPQYFLFNSSNGFLSSSSVMVVFDDNVNGDVRWTSVSVSSFYLITNYLINKHSNTLGRIFNKIYLLYLIIILFVQNKKNYLYTTIKRKNRLTEMNFLLFGSKTLFSVKNSIVMPSFLIPSYKLN